MQHLSEKMQFSGFLVYPGSAEAQVKWGGKIKYIMIAYFLRNTCAKNYRNRTVHIKIIASQRLDVFLRHSVVNATTTTNIYTPTTTTAS